MSVRPEGERKGDGPLRPERTGRGTPGRGGEEGGDVEGNRKWSWKRTGTEVKGEATKKGRGLIGRVKRRGSGLGIGDS